MHDKEFPVVFAYCADFHSCRRCKVKVKVAQSCPTLWDPMDYTFDAILQTRILEWIVFPFSRGSSQPRDWTQVSCIAGGFFTNWAMREAQGRWKWSIFSLLQWVILQYVPCCNCILNTKLGIGSMVCYWYCGIWYAIGSMEIWYASKITDNTLCLFCTWWYLHGVDIQLFSNQKPETKGK